mgnify:FL=1|jgi:hypothetical protein
MKKKITYATIAVVAIATAFLIGRNMPSKYDYLNLNQVTETEINGDTVTIYTDTDYYEFTISK